jgi:hypothetical protein
MRGAIVLLFLALALNVDGSIIYVQNKCPSTQPVVWRGANDVIYFTGSIPSGGQWNASFDGSNCESCNIGINAGATLLAECTQAIFLLFFIS